MKQFYLLLFLLGCLTKGEAQIGYTTNHTDWLITWQNGSSGRFQGTGGPALFSDNGSAADGIVIARLLTVDGTTSGTPQPLRVGQRIRIRVTAPTGGGRSGIDPSGARIGFSLRSNSNVFHPDPAPNGALSRYDVDSRFRLEFQGGESSARFLDNTGAVNSGMPGFTDFVNGITYEFEQISSDEFNLQVVGGTLYNVKRMYNSGPIRQITLYNVGRNRDAVFTDLQVVNMDSISLRANINETFTVTGIIENNGTTPNPVTKRGAGTVELTNANTYTGTTVISEGTLRLNRTGGGTLANTAVVEINNTGTLRVSANQTLSALTLRQGGTLRVDAGVTLTITGNASFNGTIQNNGRITMAGTALQTISVGGSVSYATLNDLEINNTSNEGVAVVGGSLRTAQLIFTNGRLNMNSNDLIVTSNLPGAVSEGNIGSYLFNGRLIRNLETVGAYHLPVGGAAVANQSDVLYQPLRLDLTTATAAVTIVASFVGTDPLNPGSLPPNTTVNGTSLTGVLNAGYWRVQVTSGTFNGVYTCTGSLQGATNMVSNANQYALVKRDDQTVGWSGIGTHNNSTQSQTNGIVTAARSALNAFSDFAIAYSTFLLPVNFMQFSAQLQRNGVLLQWRAAETGSLHYYEAERSNDGVLFTTIARRQPMPHTDENRYELLDAQVPAGTVHYRIAAVSQTGEKRYSKIAVLQNTKAINRLGVLSQPANRSLILQFHGFERGQYQLSIFGADGRTVLNQTIVHDGANSTRLIKLNSALPTGLYYILLQNGQVQVRESILF